jgi:U4/U6.U5 tri-snRNP-associated protein 1
LRMTEDLEGLKVSHDFEDMDEGEARILTLRDSRILDNEGSSPSTRRSFPSIDLVCAEDELQNVEMAEEERRQKNRDLKIKKRDYTGYDDEEFVPGSEGMKRAVLAKYDEDIDGPKEFVRYILWLMFHDCTEVFNSRFVLLQGFRLGASVVTKQTAPKTKEQGTASVNKSLLSIDYAST